MQCGRWALRLRRCEREISPEPDHTNQMILPDAHAGCVDWKGHRWLFTHCRKRALYRMQPAIPHGSLCMKFGLESPRKGPNWPTAHPMLCTSEMTGDIPFLKYLDHPSNRCPCTTRSRRAARRGGSNMTSVRAERIRNTTSDGGGERREPCRDGGLTYGESSIHGGGYVLC